MSTREEQIQGLREIADFLEQHPEVPVLTHDMSIYPENKLESVKAIVRTGGHWDKDYNDTFFVLSRKFAGLKLRAVFSREVVCKRIEKTVYVEEQVLPAREEVVIPATTKKIVEWDCNDNASLLALRSQDEQLAIKTEDQA